MSTILFGVDSAQPIDKLLGDVTKWAGGKPAVWGRYLGSGGGAAVPLTKAELEFARANGIAVIPIYNGAGPTSVAAGYVGGVNDALHAIALAEALGLPTMTLIVADLEYGWPVSQGWIEGWCEQMMLGPYGYGLYGGLQQPYFATPYLAAIAVDGQHSRAVNRAALWSAWWKVQQFTAGHLPVWSPGYPGDHSEKVFAWQSTGHAYGGIVDLDLVQIPLPNSWLFAAYQPPAQAPTTASGAVVVQAPPPPSGSTTTGPAAAGKPDLQSALQALDQAKAALDRARAALGG